MHPILFHWGPLTLHTYGLFMALAFLAGYAVAQKEFARSGIPQPYLEQVVFLAMVTGLLGARVFFFGVSGFADLKQDPLSFFRVWEGGLVYFGGFIFAFIALIFFARKKNLSFFTLSDALAGPLLLSHAIGRLGCFSAGCCYGKATQCPWGVTFNDPQSLAPLHQKIHPTQLYEAAGDFLLFLIFLGLRKRNPSRGLMTVYYLISYGLFRFLNEFLRGDDRGMVVGHLYPSQWISLVSMAVGGGILLYAWKNQRA